MVVAQGSRLVQVFPYDKKKIGKYLSTFFANFQYFIAKKVSDPILTNPFFHTDCSLALRVIRFRHPLMRVLL